MVTEKDDDADGVSIIGYLRNEKGAISMPDGTLYL